MPLHKIQFSSALRYSTKWNFISKKIEHLAPNKAKTFHFLDSVQKKVRKHGTHKDNLLILRDLATFSPNNKIAHKHKGISIKGKFYYLLEGLSICTDDAPLIKADLLKQLSKLYYYNQSYELALEKILATYQLLQVEQISVDADFLHYIVILYSRLKTYPKAILFSKKELIHARSNFQKAFALNNIGYSFIKENQIDSASFYLYQGLLTLDTCKHLSKKALFTYGLLKGNLSNIALIQRDTLRSIEFLEANLKKTHHLPKDPNNIKVCNKLFSLYLDREQYDKIPPLILYTDSLFKLKNPSSMFYLRTKSAYLQNLSHYYSHINQHTKSNQLRAKIKRINKTIENKSNHQKKWSNRISDQLIYSSVCKELELKERQLQIINQQQNLLLIISVSLFVAIFIIGIITYLTFYKKLKLKERENELIKKELTHKKQDLTTILLGLKIKDDALNKIYKMLENLILAPQLSNDKQLRKTIKLIEDQILHAQKLNLSQTYTEQINRSFFNTLKNTYPKLSHNDLQLCALIRLGYSTKEIASIRNIAVDSAKKSKMRLKNKINLDRNMDLSDLINEL